MHSTDRLGLRLAVLVAAIAVGLLLQHLLALRLAALDDLARTDLLRARAELASLMQGIAVLVFGLTGGLGVGIVLSSRRRVVTAPAARRLAQIGIALGVLLVAASAAGGGLLWYMAAVVRACRAGVS
jgi:hypothetical protein